MKRIGYLLIAVGLALFVFVGYLFFRQRNELVSPIPDNGNVKVTFISPTK